MIIPMFKYSIFIYHQDYTKFLDDIRQIGVVHVNEVNKEVDDELRKKIHDRNRVNLAIKELKKREKTAITDPELKSPETILEEIETIVSKREQFRQNKAILKNEIINLEPWGNFNVESFNKLKDNGIILRFFSCSEKRFDNKWLEQYNTQIINTLRQTIYFVIITSAKEVINIQAEETPQPKLSVTDINIKIEEIENHLKQFDERLDNLATSAILPLENFDKEIQNKISYKSIVKNTHSKAEDKVKFIEGYAPRTKADELDNYLEKNQILYLKEVPGHKDKVPVLLKNSRFSKLFEPIGKLFSLPSYVEVDLTPLFAPFFMLFFGFCLGDAGYGLLLFLGATIFKNKVSKELRSYLTLTQFLSASTVLFGSISGTLFGMNLIEAKFEILDNIRHLFLDSEKMFYLALILGLVQILFGMIVKVINISIQQGFKYSLSTVGWLLLCFGIIALVILKHFGVVTDSFDLLLYINIGISMFLVLFLNDPDTNVFIRFGKGIWDIYSTVTGIFGDLLSYIRLFALGLSSSILGFVFNTIALDILGSAPVIGHIFFVVILLLGHTMNILLSCLGSFVHPMRLTFVEFYKNAGFMGGGKEYKPFKDLKIESNN